MLVTKKHCTFYAQKKLKRLYAKAGVSDNVSIHDLIPFICRTHNHKYLNAYSMFSSQHKRLTTCEWLDKLVYYKGSVNNYGIVANRIIRKLNKRGYCL